MPFLLASAIILFSSPVYGNGLEMPGLNIPFCARVLGIGGAFCGQADDLSSQYYNPAGLININGKEIMALKTKLKNEMDLYSLSFGYSNKHHAFSVGWIESNISDIPIIQESYVSPTKDIHAEKETSYQTHFFNFAYAHKIAENFSVGLNSIFSFGYFNDLYYNSKYYSLSFGLHYKINKYFNLGLSLKDLINNYRFNNSQSERSISKMIAGINFKPFPALNANFDLSVPLAKNTNPVRTYFGLEYTFSDNLDLRFGLYEKIPAFGISIKNNYARISYAYLAVSNNFLGTNNMVSLKLNF